MTYRIATVFIAFTFATGSSCPPPEALDNGFLVVDGGLELHPGALPFTVAPDETVPAGVVEDAVDWWTSELDGAQALVADDDLGAAQVVVSVGLVPADAADTDVEGDALGIAGVRYDADGTVLGAEVIVSSDIAYDEETLDLVTRHELGHAFGLDNDPGPPTTVDLRSIMACPVDPLGRLTDHDRALLEPYLP